MKYHPLTKKKVSLDGGRFELSVSEDQLQAFIGLAGEDPSFESFDWQKVSTEVKEQGVVYGLLPDCEQIDDNTLLIARGKPPDPGENAYSLVVTKGVKGGGDNDIQEGDEGRVNHRELGNIVNVRKGQLLLRKVPATEGVPGLDVFGNEIKVKNGKDFRLKAGKGVDISEDGTEVKASVQGEFVLDRNKPAVYEEYEINGDIDLSTGNIYFSGVFLRITGQVMPGFRVECLGSITVGQGINNAIVISDKSISAGGGMVGDESVVKGVEGITVDFCENIGLLETKGDLEINDFIVQGHVKAEGDIKALKGKGAIIGGDYIAGGSIYALELGSDGEVVTSVTVGLNMSVERRKTTIERAKKILRPKLNEYLKSINTLTEMKKNKSIYFTDDNARSLARMNKILPQLMDKDSILTKKEEELEKDLQKGAKQCVYVYGTLFPGVKVTIAKASRVINSLEESVVLEYREKQQTINIRPMTEEEKKIPA